MATTQSLRYKSKNDNFHWKYNFVKQKNKKLQQNKSKTLNLKVTSESKLNN